MDAIVSISPIRLDVKNENLCFFNRTFLIQREPYNTIADNVNAYTGTKKMRNKQTSTKKIRIIYVYIVEETKNNVFLTGT